MICKTHALLSAFRGYEENSELLNLLMTIQTLVPPTKYPSAFSTSCSSRGISCSFDKGVTDYGNVFLTRALHYKKCINGFYVSLWLLVCAGDNFDELLWFLTERSSVLRVLLRELDRYLFRQEKKNSQVKGCRVF